MVFAPSVPTAEPDSHAEMLILQVPGNKPRIMASIQEGVLRHSSLNLTKEQETALVDFIKNRREAIRFKLARADISPRTVV